MSSEVELVKSVLLLSQSKWDLRCEFDGVAKSGNLDRVRSLVQDANIQDERYCIFFAEILKEKKYSFDVRLIVLNAIMHTCPLTWRHSKLATYHFGLSKVPPNILEEFIAALPELKAYLDLRMKLEENAAGRGYVEFDYHQSVLPLITSEALLEDEKYKDFPMPHTILLYVWSQNGFGDLATAIKVQRLVKAVDHSVQIILVNYMKSEEKEMKFLRDYPCLCQLEDQEPKTDFDPVTAVAIGVTTVTLDVMEGITFLQQKQIPYFSVAEYDSDISELSDRKNQFCAGLGMNAFGIYIDEEMQQELTTEQMSILQKFGVREKEFYFGYAHSAKVIAAFISLVLQYDEDDEINMMFVSSDVGLIVMLLESEIFVTRRNIATLRINGHSVHGCGRKNVIIRIKKCVNHEEMQALIKGSKDLCLLTGDQSFSEGLSADKLMIYEKLSHKILFWKSFCALGRSIGQQDLYDFLVNAGFSINSCAKNAPSVDCKQLVAQLEKAKESYHRLNRFVAENWNINRRIILKIKRIFAQRGECQK